MRIAAYIRVSTDEQAESGNGLDSQERQITRSILDRNWQLLDVHRDEGVSARTLERPGLQQALQLVADGEADGLMVAKLDRLTRNLGDFVDLVAWFERADAALVALDLNVDTSTPGGRAMAQIFAVFAEWERNTGAERTRAALAAIRAQGRPISRPSLHDRPELAQRVKDLRADGLSMQKICDILNAEKIPTVRGSSVWRTSALVSVLRDGPRRPPRRKLAALPAIGRR